MYPEAGLVQLCRFATGTVRPSTLLEATNRLNVATMAVITDIEIERRIMKFYWRENAQAKKKNGLHAV